MRGTVPRTRLAVVVLVLCAAVGCLTVRFVADYDEEVDKGITALQKRVDTMLLRLERDVTAAQAQYDKNTSFYDEARADLRALELRAAAHPKNTLTSQQLVLFGKSLEDLEALHKSGFRSAAAIKPLLDAFDISAKAILTFEIAKKRGDKPAAGVK